MTDEINLRGAIVLRPARAFSALRVLGAVSLCSGNRECASHRRFDSSDSRSC